VLQVVYTWRGEDIIRVHLMPAASPLTLAENARKGAPAGDPGEMFHIDAKRDWGDNGGTLSGSKGISGLTHQNGPASFNVHPLSKTVRTNRVNQISHGE
jgi:hypothetical protein